LVAEALGDTEETVKKYYYERFPASRIASLVSATHIATMVCEVNGENLLQTLDAR
jgi:hypothetical protein